MKIKINEIQTDWHRHTCRLLPSAGKSPEVLPGTLSAEDGCGGCKSKAVSSSPGPWTRFTCRVAKLQRFLPPGVRSQDVTAAGVPPWQFPIRSKVDKVTLSPPPKLRSLTSHIIFSISSPEKHLACTHALPAHTVLHLHSTGAV